MIQHTIKLLRTLGVEVIKSRRKINSSLKDELNKACVRLKSSPFRPSLQSHMATLRYELKKIEIYEAKGAKIHARMYWLKVGDKVSK